MKHLEFRLQKQVTRYLRLKYKDVYFMSDTIANVKLTLQQAARNKSIQCDNFHCPDLIILQPNKEYHGLFIELKKESPFKKNGELKKNDHLLNQSNTMIKLKEKGYQCFFSWNFDQCCKIIDDYMKNI